MDRDEATEIHKHLFDAYSAVNRAVGVAMNFDAEGRKVFSVLLRGFHRDCDDILENIYANFPDLRPRREPQESPEIDSPMRWVDVVLPASVTEADLDRIIFSRMSARPMKAALIIGDVVTECQRLSWPITPEIVGARIEQLSDDNRIDSRGDLRYWRHSEVRLKQDPSR